MSDVTNLPAAVHGRPTPNQWWGAHSVPTGHTRRFIIGPLSLWVTRAASEWRLATLSGEDPVDNTLEIARPGVGEEVPPEAVVRRFATSGPEDHIHLWPVLADRAVVSRPDQNFQVQPREEVILYVGSPLWLSVSAGNNARPLTEIPLYRPSDTWFGPPTAEGELCYAIRTQCRMSLDEVPLRPHRAVTATRINNRVDTPLVLERLKLPVKHLDLYVADTGRLWTQDITLERREGDGFAEMEVIQRPPSAAAGATRLTPARTEAAGSLLVRAFSTLFN